MTDLKTEYSERYAKVLEPLTDRLLKHLEGIFDGVPRVERIAARAKSAERFMAKAQKTVDGSPKYTEPLAQVQDQIGARIIVFYLSDIEFASTRIEQHIRRIEKQNILPESESEFGYIGKHYILHMPSDVLGDGIDADDAPAFFELQVRTLFQHAWSEAGHDVAYKPSATLTSDDRRKVAFTAAQAWGADQIFEELHKAG